GGIDFSLVWVPGHVGIAGNEEADSEAKKAAGGVGSPPADLPQALKHPLPLSVAAAKAAYKLTLPEQHRVLLTNAGRIEKLQQTDPNTPLTNYRKIVSRLTR
ncbi:hypothetical protein M422DRAFT_83205, partial [Sphaerobolus stellatus SS14]